MRIEPFDGRQPDKVILDFAQFFFGVIHNVADLRIVVDRQSRKKPRRGPGRQDVIRPRDVIGDGRRGIAPQEQCAGMSDFLQIIKRLVYGQGEMLGRDLVRHIDRFIDRRDHENDGIFPDGLGRDFLTL